MLLAALAFPGSLVDQGSEAHNSLTRVRLLHSALRHWLPRSGRLKAHKDLVADHIYVEGELPINQQDLAITLGVFCYINLRSLRRMGIRFSSDDIESYVQMWRYAGCVSLPSTLPFGVVLMPSIAASQSPTHTNTQICPRNRRLPSASDARVPGGVYACVHAPPGRPRQHARDSDKKLHPGLCRPGFEEYEGSQCACIFSLCVIFVYLMAHFCSRALYQPPSFKLI